MVRDRIRQFVRASARPTRDDLAFARERLSPELYRLFAAQTPRDMVHSVQTARWLLARGHDDPDLVTAALVHDVGKGAQRTRDRVAYVLCDAVGLAGRAASPRSRFEMRSAMARSLTHSERGAELLAAAGAPPRVVSLARLHHADPGEDAMLRLLQRADADS